MLAQFQRGTVYAVPRIALALRSPPTAEPSVLPWVIRPALLNLWAQEPVHQTQAASGDVPRSPRGHSVRFLPRFSQYLRNLADRERMPPNWFLLARKSQRIFGSLLRLQTSGLAD